MKWAGCEQQPSAVQSQKRRLDPPMQAACSLMMQIKNPRILTGTKCTQAAISVIQNELDARAVKELDQTFCSDFCSDRYY